MLNFSLSLIIRKITVLKQGRGGFKKINEPNKPVNRLIKYNWEQADWPEFKCVEDSLFTFATKAG